MPFGRLRNQIIVAQSLAIDAPHHRSHLVCGACGAIVMPAFELAYVAVKMLDAELVIGPDVPMFQHRPKRFNLVGVCHPVNVAACAMTNGLMRVRAGHRRRRVRRRAPALRPRRAQQQTVKGGGVKPEAYALTAVMGRAVDLGNGVGCDFGDCGVRVRLT